MAKGKKKGKKSKDTFKKLTFVEDAFYQLTVQDCEKKIDHLQKHLQFLEVNNDDIKEKIRSLNYDQADKAGDMTRSLRGIDETIYKYHEEIHALTREFDEIKRNGDATIMDLEEKYQAMRDQLTCEIKLLKAKFKMLEDFRLSENKLNLIIEDKKEVAEEKNEEYKNAINTMELKIQGEKEAMQKEIETKLVRVSEEFTRSSALRDAAYAQRLIRENIALEKEIDILKNTQKSMDQQLKEHTERCKEIKETFSSLYRKKRELIFVAQQKTHLIERTTTKYEKLKSAYTDSLLYKSQYEDLVQYQLCKHYQQRQMVTRAKKLATRAHLLKSECNYLEYKYGCNEREIFRLNDITLLIRKTILDSLCIFEKASQASFVPEAEVNIEYTETATSEKCSSERNSSDFSSKDVSEEIEGKEEEEETAEICENAYTVESKSPDMHLLEVLLEILERLKVDDTRTTSVETVTPNSFLLRYPDLVPQSSDSMRESFKHGESLKRGSEYTEDIQLFKQESKDLIPKERMERCLLFDVEKGSSLYASTSKSEAIVEEHEPDEFKDQESSSYESLLSEEEKPTPLPKQVVEEAEEKNSKQLDLPPGTIVDVEMDANEDLTSLKSDKYSSDIGEEMDSVKEPTEPDDEMSIYMFY